MKNKIPARVTLWVCPECGTIKLRASEFGVDGKHRYRNKLCPGKPKAVMYGNRRRKKIEQNGSP